MLKGMIFDVQKNSFVDGPGIRTTVFFKGCNLNCGWCHNPESKSPKKQIMYFKDKCKGCGKCREVCPNSFEKCDFCGKCEEVCYVGARKVCGREYEPKEVLDKVIKDKIFYDVSGGGVTFSGGECMLQIDFLEELLKQCRENGINTAVDTAGNVPWEYFERIMPQTDIFFYDVKCVTDEKHVWGTGVHNKLILQNLKKLSETFDGKIIIRIPLIPNFNDGDEMDKIKEFLKKIKYSELEVLPYHKMGENKSKALGCAFTDYPIPTQSDADNYRKSISEE